MYKRVVKIYAIGKTPEDALRNLYGRPKAYQHFEIGSEHCGGVIDYAWNRYFGLKYEGEPLFGNVFGHYYPGGCVILALDKVPEMPHKEDTWGICAIGINPYRAVLAMAAERGWGKVENFRELPDENLAEGQWFCGFTAGGTGFKASGWNVPGGSVLTWWK